MSQREVYQKKVFSTLKRKGVKILKSCKNQGVEEWPLFIFFLVFVVIAVITKLIY
jgi:hypothetical protein